MHKIRFGSKKHSHQAVDAARIMRIAPGGSGSAAATGADPSGPNQGTALPPRVIEKTTSDDHSFSSMTAANKRRLSPSHVQRDSEDMILKEQRLGQGGSALKAMSSDANSPAILAAISTSNDACDAPLRRSSMELRGVAQAITSSKLKLYNGEIAAGDEDENRTDGTYNLSHSGGGRQRPEERRSSTASLVDGGVEAATHTIVTDAIETLLFDERHTRETYLKHEKELSISSLPGVVPISKQLFAGAFRGATAAAANVRGNTNAGNRTSFASTDARKAATTCVQNKPSTNNTFTISKPETLATYGDLEAATREGGGFSTPRKVTEVKETDESLEASPSRMEAAAALVSQSKQGKEETARFAATRGR